MLGQYGGIHPCACLKKCNIIMTSNDLALHIYYHHATLSED